GWCLATPPAGAMIVCPAELRGPWLIFLTASIWAGVRQVAVFTPVHCRGCPVSGKTKGFFSEKCRRCKCLKTRMKEPSEVLGSGRPLLKIAAGGHQDRRAARSTLQAGNPPSRPESRRARFGNSRSRLLGGHGPSRDLNSVSSTYAPDTFGRRADKGSRIERRL